ncbi:C-C motif chemokine 17 [Tachyglossus aculeatus]|uniref:C-C motif chemokine 17 n=1 Tax=Tachyglossus aculeatus TaxID=9261 RepID=UPI0018F2E1C6|nr:C-C motif chemokine 17 [Tachyglossus aculeatus]
MHYLKTALLIAFILGLSLPNIPAARGTNTGKECCSDYIKKPIKFCKVVSCQKTSVDCLKEAIVFNTVQNHTICADPNQNWVKKAVKLLKTWKSKTRPASRRC